MPFKILQVRKGQRENNHLKLFDLTSDMKIKSGLRGREPLHASQLFSFGNI